mmetsp:Transcript_15608/g.39975  ORF Transcript_15608/g.39975 Transcript_15608/m.39975 type:complete len:279 (-) Transcript_15608:272-1108(-)
MLFWGPIPGSGGPLRPVRRLALSSRKVPPLSPHGLCMRCRCRRRLRALPRLLRLRRLNLHHSLLHPNHPGPNLLCSHLRTPSHHSLPSCLYLHLPHHHFLVRLRSGAPLRLSLLRHGAGQRPRRQAPCGRRRRRRRRGLHCGASQRVGSRLGDRDRRRLGGLCPRVRGGEHGLRKHLGERSRRRHAGVSKIHDEHRRIGSVGGSDRALLKGGRRGLVTPKKRREARRGRPRGLPPRPLLRRGLRRRQRRHSPKPGPGAAAPHARRHRGGRAHHLRRRS